MLLLRPLLVALALLAVGASGASAATPTLKPLDVRVDEGHDGTKVVRVGVVLPRKAKRSVRVKYATSARSADRTDFAGERGTLLVRKGAKRGTITILVLGDRAIEPDERFVVKLSGARGARLADSTADVTIADDDKPVAAKQGFREDVDMSLGRGAIPRPVMHVDDASVAEPAGTGAAVPSGAIVRLSFAPVVPATADVSVASVPAERHKDYEPAASIRVTFAPGETEKAVPVSILGDALDEGDETLSVTVSNIVGAVVTDSLSSVTIVDADDDVAPAVTIGDAALTEPTGWTNVAVPVTLAAPSGKPITLRVHTQDGTAKAGDGLDYEALDSTVTFGVGQTTKQVQVRVLDDLRDEDNQKLDVVLSNPENVTIADGTGTVTITDNDVTPNLHIDDVLRLENDVDATFSVTLSAPSDKQVSVKVATQNGTAKSGTCGAGGDYVAKSATVLVPAGTTSVSVPVKICEDKVIEPNETFSVALSTATNAAITGLPATGTIQDDD